MAFCLVHVTEYRIHILQLELEFLYIYIYKTRTGLLSLSYTEHTTFSNLLDQKLPNMCERSIGQAASLPAGGV
jgi:hypothetical protein